MTQLNAGKTTVLTLSATLVVASFLFLNNISTISADNEKLNMCHNTGSGSNPWVTQQVNANQLQSHLDNGDFIYSGPLKSNGHPENANNIDSLWCEANQPGGTPSPTPSATPTPSADPCIRNENCTTATPAATATPTATPVVTSTPEASATPFVTPVCTGDTHLDAAGKNCVSFEYNGAPASNGSNGQVLGASTMAGTGSFEESLYQGIMTLGATLSAFGIKGLKKAKKVSKK